MYNKFIRFLLLALVVITMTGCSKQKDQINGIAPAEKEPVLSTENTESPTETPKTGNPATADELFALAQNKGSVADFTATGCTLAPTQEEQNDGFSIGAAPAPGYEEGWEQVPIIYDDDCIFQYVYANLTTGAVRFEDAAVQNVKKQSTIVIWGEYDSDNILHASRVFIYRME